VKRYTIVVEPGAEDDLNGIAEYIAAHDSVDRAIDVTDRIQRSFSTLEALPNRGVYPKELLDYGNRDYREIYFKPYRTIYRVLEGDALVIIVLIADGRRDMQTLLTRRLLGA
jgi:toxin ParE1/3/4